MQCLGEDRAKIYDKVKKKNRECSLYGFVCGDGREGSSCEESIKSLCRKLMHEAQSTSPYA